MTPQFFDAIIVGAGFSGLSCLHGLRKFGFSCKVFEAGAGMGGIWNWNCYPGARVDTEYPVYQFQQPEIVKDFHWSERFPGWMEMQAYFAYVDQHHNFSRDIQFNTKVVSAVYNSELNQWEVTTADSVITTCRFLILCTGFASKLYKPQFLGTEKFSGKIFHTGDWTPEQNIDFKNKRVAVIGTGASGVQVIQELGPIVDRLTVFQRTPNMAIPMEQRNRNDNWSFPTISEYPREQERDAQFHNALSKLTTLFSYSNATEQERLEFLEDMYAKGGLAFWLENFKEMLIYTEANDCIYEFWRQKTGARITDPLKRELLAPVKAPHSYGTKRPSLEQSYYEVFNQENVDLIDLRQNQISEFTANGIKMKNGKEIDAEIIILATGFDAVTGGILDIEIKNGEGLTLSEHWKNGLQTFLGMTTTGFPNFFFLYGPQSTTAFSNGPTSAKFQSDFLLELLVWMRMNSKPKIVAKTSETRKWTSLVQEFWSKSFFRLTASSYQGSNIPGKKIEPLNFIGGNPNYIHILEKIRQDGYDSFDFEN